jgi:CO/xanthine dehydrogenase FAD-binding subunit
VNAPNVARPRDLREALGVAFVHRDRTRWRAGKSRFLGVDYTRDDPAGGVLVDVADIIDFRDIRADRHGLRIGAFADPEAIGREPLVRQILGGELFAPEVARFRLAALGAQLEILGIGTTRKARLEDALGPNAVRPLAESEIPLAVELRSAGAPTVTFGDRRIRRDDGAATFDLRVFVALDLVGVHRIGSATVAYCLDGEAPVQLQAVEAALRGAMIAKGTFSNAARHAADAFRSDDVKANTLRRTIIPLVLSALKDAYTASRATRP